MVRGKIKHIIALFINACLCSMGKRKLRFDVRKNFERNKKIKLTVRIPLECIKPFIVSLPLNSYIDA